MSQIETNSATQKYRERCEDRIDIIQSDQRTVIVVADGAGGLGSGDLAADTVVREIRSHYAAIHSADEWATLLHQIDSQIPSGESTAVVIDIRPFGIAGASATNGKFSAMKAEVNRVCAFHPFRRDKKALPLFDVCFLTTNTNKGRAMSGKAAKVFFDRGNVHDFDQTL